MGPLDFVSGCVRSAVCPDATNGRRCAIDFFDVKNPPPLAFTVAHAMRLIDANRDARRGWVNSFRPCWWPDVSWRMTGGGCYSPDANDASYIRGEFRFVYPYNQPRLRRQMARKDGRMGAVRVPLLDWFWWSPGFSHCGHGMYELKPYVRASELQRGFGSSKCVTTAEASQ